MASPIWRAGPVSGRLIRFGLIVAALQVGAWFPISAAHAFTLSGPANYNVPPLTVAHGLQAVTIGDFNGDSDPDLALAHEDAYKVSVLLGAAGGSFTGPSDVPLFSSSNPLSVVVGDFNGDSDPDLVTANEGSSDGVPPGNVSILLGAAGGTFTGPTNFSAGEKPQEVAIGDFNGDSDPDLAVANASPSLAFGTVSILLGTAGVNFTAPTNYTVGNSPRAVAIGDFNGDTDPDLAVASQGNDKVSVMLGAAAGTFTGPTDLSAYPGTPNSIAIGDFNGDSDPDLAVVNETGNNVSVWLGATGGSFGPRTDFSVGNLPDRVAIGDLNGDSRPDLAVANQASDNLTVLLGLGTGSFTGPFTFGAADGPTGVAIGQFNADSRLDLALTNEISNNVSIFLGSPDGYARPQSATPLSFALVPAFAECTAPNSTHGGPLASSSCNPPAQASSFLTVNAPDRPPPFNTASDMTGFLKMKVFCTDGANPPCPAPGDQADVEINSTITGVRCIAATGGCSAAGGTYAGKLLFSTALQITDRQNSPGQEPGTATGTPLQFGMQCASGACNLSTTADAVIPGIVQEGKRSVWQLGDIQVFDGGSDGDLVAAAAPPGSGTCPPACAGNGGETLFLRQGLFAP